MISAKALLSNLSEPDVLLIMEHLGATPVAAKPNELWFRTVCHGGHSHKLCLFRDSLRFCCYTNCGSMSIFDLVQQALGLDFGESVRWVGRLLGVNERVGFDRTPVTQHEHVPAKYLLRRRDGGDSPVSVPTSYYDSMILNYFEHDVFCGAWLDEGISPCSMQKFGIAWYELGRSVVIPHHDITGGLIGIRRRSFLPFDLERGCKYMPLIIENQMYSHPVGLHLYGLYECQAAIKKHRKVILVEGEKSVLLSHTYYGEDSVTVATCGFNITEPQKQLILNQGVEEVILGFDKDYEPLAYDDCDLADCQEYQRFMQRIETLAHKFTARCRVFVLWDNLRLLQLKDSPFDRGKEVFETLMTHKVEVTTIDGKD